MNIRSGGMSERNTFWLSAAIHLLILIIYLLMLYQDRQAPAPEEAPALYVPSYAYSSPQIDQAAAQQTQSHERPVEKTEPVKQTTTNQQASQNLVESTLDRKNSDFDLGRYAAKQQELAKAPSDPSEINLASFKPAASSKKTDPVHMIGDKLTDDPLKKLLGIAITRHLYYPEAAQELNMRGVVGVGFMLFPDGTATNVRVVETSKQHVLDAAAIAAVKDMGPTPNIDIYVKKPRFLVVNIIFR